jgi:energy-converting hydrogenase B subunit D
VSPLVATALLLVAVAGTVVVVTRDPARQAVVLSVFGLFLAVLFTTLQAPDVALSQLVVGAAVVPLMLLLAVTTMGGGRR